MKKLKKHSDGQEWTAVITSKTRRFSLNLKEVWKYRDLIWLTVRRDFKTRYKQTILGPLWFIIQPLLSTFIYNFVFGSIAGLAPGGVPSFLFFMLGNITWTFFASSLTMTSATFTGNAALFGKVYFPRLTMPISTMITRFIDFIIQFLMYLLFALYFFLTSKNFEITWVAVLTPVLLLQAGILGLGFGIIISSVTTKYRDLQVLVGFGVSLWMYLTPVVYSLSSLPFGGSTAETIIMCNPVTPIILLMRYGWLGCEYNPNIWMYWGISVGVTMIVLILGIMIFNRIEKNFLDTV